MRKSTRALTALPTAAPTVGVAGPALATIQARPLERALANAAFQPRSGQPVIDWNRELITCRAHRACCAQHRPAHQRQLLPRSPTRSPTRMENHEIR